MTRGERWVGWHLAIVMLITPLASSCRRRPRDELAAQLFAEQSVAAASSAGAKPALPALTLNDDTRDLSLTWVDAKGDAHIVDKLSEVPAEGRDRVRVVIENREDGRDSVFYVANLNAKTPDGSYPVTTMSRDEWEGMMAQRREELLKARAAAAAPPDPGLGSPDDTPAAAGSGASGSASQVMPLVIVYGASWCGACHQAMEYLKRRHIPAIEKDIERDPAAEAEMQKKLARIGRRGSAIPIIDVKGKIMVGFDPQAIEQALAGSRPSAVTL